MSSYPYLSDVIKGITGYDLPLPIAMFGLFVGFGMLAAAACLQIELRRLHAAGRIANARRQVRNKNGENIIVEVAPHQIVTDLVFVVMLAGVIGARLFHILEHLDSFLADPWSMIFSRSGLSVFGGLILGTGAGIIFIKRWNLPARLLLDAVAPAMMLGYAIGRIGCQVSGDGDWGIASNMSIKPNWLPMWAWAQTYGNNIIGEVIAAPGVYPTPMYETLLALACFAAIWALRKHPFKAGWLFSLYLLFAGLERLLIEQIRVNPIFDLGFVHATQAEVIAAALIFFGLVGLASLSGHRNADRLIPT
ncbi:prolipoprotein diacylglyceryl transferase [Massilia horti]|uniref:Prolipoprotein diacylglyceryl transferase n=1 Tax=Massilia horti TaxID=2562153 RepID=A0A4Y9SSN0_9BURK|nr:prolipoprotein diacylglyceryl transferase family protein [Massilia horti]TFW28507.1 prolipoprotein diacylglyceryl transferase [Massilia horti]